MVLVGAILVGVCVVVVDCIVVIAVKCIGKDRCTGKRICKRFQRLNFVQSVNTAMPAEAKLFFLYLFPNLSDMAKQFTLGTLSDQDKYGEHFVWRSVVVFVVILGVICVRLCFIVVVLSVV